MDEKLLGRLVDGELSGEEYRTVLARMEDEPEGWRRCALGFLEAQAWGQELPVVRRNLESAEQAVGAMVAAQTPAKQQWLSVLAIAASFFAAFGLGIVVPKFFPSGTQESVEIGNNYPQPGTPDVAVIQQDNLRNIGNVQLVVDGGEPGDARQLPVFEVEQGMEQLLTSSEQAIAPVLIDLLRKQGYDVQHEQQYVPATLEDGRQMIVPLDGYQIRPVSRRY